MGVPLVNSAIASLVVGCIDIDILLGPLPRDLFRDWLSYSNKSWTVKCPFEGDIPTVRQSERHGIGLPPVAAAEPLAAQWEPQRGRA
jgi:hypothetical protein